MKHMAERAAAIAAVLALGACGSKPTPPPLVKEAAAVAPVAPVAPPPAAPATEPPLALPAGQTLGDALPHVPSLPRRLASGVAAGALVPQTSCADLLPAD